jgi:transcriptional regulator with XRE-family HTH domain
MALALWATICQEYAIGIEQSLLQAVTWLRRGITDPMKIFDRVLNPREIRRRLGLNQEQFWTQIGVTQSGGSRYESGREMPKPVRELLRLVHVEQVDLSQVKRVDFEIISHLKTSHPDLYRSLRRAVKGRVPETDASGAHSDLEPSDAADPIDLPLPDDERPRDTHSF